MLDSAPQCDLGLCHSFGSTEQKHFQLFSCCSMGLFIELTVFRYLTLVLIRSTHSLGLIPWKAAGAAGQWQREQYLRPRWVFAAHPNLSCAGLCTLPGPDPAVPSDPQGSPQLEPPQCPQDVEQETHLGSYLPGHSPFP